MALVQARPLRPTRGERVALAASAAIAAWVAGRMEARAARVALAISEGHALGTGDAFAPHGEVVAQLAREEQARRASLLGLR